MFRVTPSYPRKFEQKFVQNETMEKYIFIYRSNTSQAQWLEPKHCEWIKHCETTSHAKLYENMQLSKLRGCQTYLPNYAVAVQKKLHLHFGYNLTFT